MKGQELKILFRENMAFLTKEVALDFKQVEIPPGSVRFKAPAFWTIRVINYNAGEKKIFVEVLNYQVGETEFAVNQIELADMLMEIEKVTFRGIDTPGWLNTLNGTKPRKFIPIKPETVYRTETPVRVPVKVIYNETFSVPIKDVTFLSGRVTFDKKIQQLGKSIKFEIPNESIIEEYDAIKNYFANVLKTKKIQVVPNIITEDGVPISINATSIEIGKIDKTFIEEVKFEMVKAAGKKEVPGDQQLFTKDEYLETFAGEETGQFFKDDNDFLENLLERSGTKHHNHLRFLSSKHLHVQQKLRFVHKPFSFVFLLKGVDTLHIVWETLDTEEATYIWNFANDEDLKQVLTRTDKTINLIIRNGKNEYISRKEENFNRVFHDYSDLQNGFKNWKAEVEKIVF